MYSQNTIALKRSRIAQLSSLIWLATVVLCIVLAQWSVPLQVACLGLFALGYLYVFYIAKPRHVSWDDKTVYWSTQTRIYPVRLVFQNEYWMVLACQPSPEDSFFTRMMLLLNGRYPVYRDQLDEADYRYLRSRLNVERWLDWPAQKNESEVLK